MSFIEKNIYLIVTFIFLLFLIISITRIGSYALDEDHYHYPNVLNFYKNGLNAIFNKDYSAANTPFPYIIVFLFSKLFSPSVALARIITAFVSLMTVFIIMKLLSIQKTEKYLSLVILFYPYFFVNSFVFYTVNYGLLFSLLSILYLYNIQEKFSYISYFLMGLFMSLAICSQQFYLMIPLAMIIFTIYSNIFIRRLEIKKIIISFILFLIPLILPLLIFIGWGGLTHPNFRIHTISFYPSTIVGIFFVTGFYFFPLLLQNYNIIKIKEILFSILLSFILIIFFKPIFSHHQGAGIFTGLTHHFIYIISKFSNTLSILLMLLLSSMGVLILIKLYKMLHSPIEYFLYFTLIILIFVFTFNTIIGEKHLLPFITFLFLLVLPKTQKKYYRIYLIFLPLLGLIYFIYWYFIKFA